MAFDPFTFAATVAVNLASYAVQDRAKRKAARQAEFDGGVEVPEVGTPQALPILYGRSKTKGIVSGVRLARRYTAPSISASETAGADVWLTSSRDSGREAIVYDPSDDSYQDADNTLLTNKDAATRNDFLFVQYAIGQGGINRIRNIDVGGLPIDDEDIGYGQRVHTFAQGGTADPLATSNGFAGTNKFADCAYATGAFRYNPEAPQYSGIPNLDFYVEGRKVRSVTRSGSAGSYTYALSSGRTYSNNMALVLLDYMAGEHGANIPVSDIDLESFYDAAQVCARVLTRNGYQGYEPEGATYLYGRSSTPTLTAAQKPTGPGTAGGVTWSSAEPAYTHLLPYLWQSHRTTGGTTWSDPVPVDPFHREGRQWRVPVSTKVVTQAFNEDQMSRVHFSGVVKSQLFAEAEELAFDMALRRRDTGAVQTFTIVFRESDVEGPEIDPNLPWSWFENSAMVMGAPTQVDLGAGHDYEQRYVMRQTRSTGGITFSASDSTYLPPNAEDMTPVRIWRYKSSAGENESLIQGEFNGGLNPDDPVWDNVLKIVSVMQRAKLIWSYGGWTLKIPYPRSQGEQDGLKTHHIVDAENEPGTDLTRIDIMRNEPFIVNPPSFETRLNVANGGYKNENSDYDSDSLQWPRYAPAAETSSPYRTYLSEDNSRVLSGSLRLDGITDPFHMRIAVEQQVRSSRSESAYSFAASMDALELEIGDIVPVTAFGYDEDIEIDSLEPVDWSYVRITGHSFRYQDLAINVADDYAASRPPYTNFAVAPPTLAAGDFDSDNRVIPLTITPPEATASAEFLIEQHIGTIAEDTDPESLEWTDVTRTRAVMHEVLVASGERVYNFRARTVSPGGRLSAGSNVVTVGVDSFSGSGATDGIGVEEVFALFPSTVLGSDGTLTLAAADQPDNTWAYDIVRGDMSVPGSGPQTRGDATWTDGPSAPTEAKPVRVKATRSVPGQPSHGAAKQTSWSDWAWYPDAVRPPDGRFPAIELDVYLTVSDAPASGATAPATPTATSYTYATDTLAGLTTMWTRSRPLALSTSDVLYCATASVSDDGTGVDSTITFSAPVVCNDVIDIDIVYTRAAAAPATPDPTAFAVIAAGWYALPSLIPEATTGTEWQVVRYLRISEGNLRWTYDNPTRHDPRLAPPSSVVLSSGGGDDPRVVYHDPSDTEGIGGYEIQLERDVGGGDWEVVASQEADGLTTAQGRGRTFSNVEPGTYRARVRSTPSVATYSESNWEYSNTVVTTDVPDNSPSKVDAPTLTYNSTSRRFSVTYTDPSSDGGSNLTLFAAELYRDGTAFKDRVDADTLGVRQGRTLTFPLVTSIPGEYKARVAAQNGNGRGLWSDFSNTHTISGSEGGDGENAVYFRQPVVEIPVQADGESIPDATFFDPDPAIAVLTLVEAAGTTTDVTVSLDVSATGVVATLDNTTDFEIVT